MTEPNDQELEQYLKGGSALSRRYRDASREKTSTELDEQVLALARAEVRRKPRANRWLPSLALAASAILGVNLAWNLRDQATPGSAPETESLHQLDEEAPAPAAELTRDAPAELDDVAPSRDAEPKLRERRTSGLQAPAATPPQASAGSLADGMGAAMASDSKQEMTLAHEEADERHNRAVAAEAEDYGTQAMLSAAPQTGPPATPMTPQQQTAQKASEARLGPLPAGWYLRGNNAPAYQAAVDESIMHSAPDSLVLWRSGAGGEGCGRLERIVSAEPYHGKRVLFSAALQAQGVAKFAALQLAVDGSDLPSSILPSGDTPWQQREVALDVPEHAGHLSQSILLCGSGTVWIDDVELNEIGPEGDASEQ